MASSSAEHHPSHAVPFGVIAFLALMAVLGCGMCSCLLMSLVVYTQICWT